MSARVSDPTQCRVVDRLCDRVCATTGGCTSDPAPRGDWRPPAEVNGALLRAFSPDSWWNLPVPQNAPDNPGGDEILRYLSTPRDAGECCVELAGSEGNSWDSPSTGPTQVIPRRRTRHGRS